MLNVAVNGARSDLTIDYALHAAPGDLLLFFNGTYLDLSQQNTPQSSSQTLSGFAFYPPKFRLRTGPRGSEFWALTGTVNYLPRETTTKWLHSRSGSWTTVDASLRYAPCCRASSTAECQLAPSIYSTAIHRWYCSPRPHCRLQLRHRKHDL